MDISRIGVLFNNAYENTGIKDLVEKIDEVIDNSKIAGIIPFQGQQEDVQLNTEIEAPMVEIPAANIERTVPEGLTGDGYYMFNAIWQIRDDLFGDTDKITMK